MSDLVGNPEDRFSGDAAQMYMVHCTNFTSIYVAPSLKYHYMLSITHC